MTTERVALADVEAMVADGRLVDQTTVLALLLARGGAGRAGADGAGAERAAVDGGRGVPVVAGRGAGPLRQHRGLLPPGPRAPTRRPSPAAAAPRPTPAPATWPPTSSACGPAGAAPPPWPAASRRCAGCTASSSTRGEAPSDPTSEVAGPALPGRLPKALSEDEVDRLLAAVSGERPIARRDRGTARGPLRHRWAHLRGGRPGPGGSRARATGCCASTARGPRSGWSPSAGARSRPWTGWLAPEGRAPWRPSSGADGGTPRRCS